MDYTKNAKRGRTKTTTKLVDFAAFSNEHLILCNGQSPVSIMFVIYKNYKEQTLAS